MNTPALNIDAVLEFLQSLRPNGPWTITAIDPSRKGSTKTDTFYLDNVHRAREFIRRAHGKCNLYYSVNPVRGSKTKKAQRIDIAALEYLHVDIDPQPDHDLQAEQVRIRELLTARLPTGAQRPTAVIFSGGGFQALWKLKVPLALDGTIEHAEQAKQHNLVLEKMFGADSTHNIDRILRLPGTMNLPNAKKAAMGRRPTLAELIEADWSRSYDLSDLTPATDDAPSSREPTAGPLQIEGRAVALSSLDGLDRWSVPERIRTIISLGHHPDEDNKPRDDRSRWVFDVVCGLLRCQVLEELIVGVITDPQWKISEHVLEQADPTQYAHRQLENARAAIAHDEEATGELVVSKADPRHSARQYLIRCRPSLLRFNGDWLAYEGGAYHDLEEDTVRAEIYAFLETASVHVRKQGEGTERSVRCRPDSAMVSGVYDALRALVHRPSNVFRPPVWLNGEGPPAAEIISCRNGLLHLATGVLMPPTPGFFTRNALQFDYQADAPPPAQWLHFLHQLWGGGPEIQVLQEIFGYCLVPDTSMQKIFLFVGPKRAGKGTIARVLTQLVGEVNVCAPSLNSLGETFALQQLLGKQLAIVSDMRMGYRTDVAAVAEDLLRISGEDDVTVNRKFKEAWTGRLGVRFLIMSNEIPRLPDGSAVLASRFVPLTMDKSFYGQEDRSLGAKLEGELPGILNWAIEGWRRLQVRGQFELPASSLAAIEELEEMSSPASAFLRDRCELVLDAQERKLIIWEEYKRWCSENNEQPGNMRQFSKNLIAASGRRVRPFKPAVEGRRVPHFQGIRLKNEQEM